MTKDAEKPARGGTADGRPAPQLSLFTLLQGSPLRDLELAFRGVRSPVSAPEF